MTLLRLTSIRGYALGDQGSKKIAHILEKEAAGIPMEKAFPLGRSYGVVPIGGVNVRQNPIDLTLNLLTALTSSDVDRRAAAAAHFDETKIRSAQQYASSKVIYGAIREYLPRIKERDFSAARQALHALENAFPRSEAITDLVTSVDGHFTQDITFDALEARVQHGVFKDLFDNRDTLCCAFYPSGANAPLSINYLLDEHVGLLHLIPRSCGESLDPIGVAIMIQAQDARTKEKYLLIDSVEAGTGVDRIRDSIWIPLMHRAIMSTAADTGMDFVIYNTRGEQMNAKPRRVLSYVAKTANPQIHEIPLLKLQAEHGRIAGFDDGSQLLAARAARARDRDEYDSGYDAQNKVRILEQQYRDNIRIYAEAWGRGVCDPNEFVHRDAQERSLLNIRERGDQQLAVLPVAGGMTCGYVLPVVKNESPVVAPQT